MNLLSDGKLTRIKGPYESFVHQDFPAQSSEKDSEQKVGTRRTSLISRNIWRAPGLHRCMQRLFYGEKHTHTAQARKDFLSRIIYQP